nr:immunoglobulin heavy chain junction region [Mus musculus]MBK4196458.1 immunoglobulin heavy chain junction region [Mus musculus]MBK4196459.1 immunoglobulin heavy chain junction region [Mus musculus]
CARDGSSYEGVDFDYW